VPRYLLKRAILVIIILAILAISGCRSSAIFGKTAKRNTPENQRSINGLHALQKNTSATDPGHIPRGLPLLVPGRRL
jgi:hypothetical protein